MLMVICIGLAGVLGTATEISLGHIALWKPYDPWRRLGDW